MSTLAHRQSELEHVQAATEAIVEQRTHDLAEVKRHQELILCSLGEGILGIYLEGRGLAIAHSVVCRKHGGKLNVVSEVGKGSTFTILLPLEPATEPAAS
jgi:C4-dicarboxylate-specific signal transduction histidine kinase